MRPVHDLQIHGAHVQRHPEVITFPGLLIWRIGGDLLFASIRHVMHRRGSRLALEGVLGFWRSLFYLLTENRFLLEIASGPSPTRRGSRSGAVRLRIHRHQDPMEK